VTAKDDGHKAIARLRLSALLMEEKAYDEALKQLSVPFAAEYAAVVADRKGDVLVLQGKKQEAVEEYSRAYQAFSESIISASGGSEAQCIGCAGTRPVSQGFNGGIQVNVSHRSVVVWGRAFCRLLRWGRLVGCS
jgi:tetratricopeptide (TPR) repeat protein